MLKALRDTDVRDLLPKVSVPTLVMHRRKDRAVRIEAGRHGVRLYLLLIGVRCHLVLCKGTHSAVHQNKCRCGKSRATEHFQSPLKCHRSNKFAPNDAQTVKRTGVATAPGSHATIA